MTTPKLLIAILLATLFGVSSGVVGDTDPGSTSNEYCPVTPEELVDAEHSTLYNRERVYFCCSKCQRRFEKDPEAYNEGLAAVMAVSESAAANHEHTGHDHSHHSREESSGVWAVVEWLGRFHPVVVHFPIALVLVLGLAEVLAMAGRGIGLPATRFLLVIALVSSVLGAALGWANAAFAEGNGSMADVLLMHRVLGSVTPLLVGLSWGLFEHGNRTGSQRSLRIYRGILLLAGGVVAVAGHLGGTLVFGEGYFKW